ncbi:MAG: hypothetical protein KDC66_04705 [Phaeodactylibacter sp.]|nr:hypothetical protein [Phaeodactylibacter sp.]MCB9276184.1 hypothetical protein [Lewinellaceae bacterium]
MKYIFSIIAAILLALSSSGQPIDGHWEGYITQDGKKDTFYYQVDLQVDGQAVNGEALSRTPDGANTARFQFTGFWDGKELTLQEVRQLEPKTPKWCLKYASLRFRQTATMAHLEGAWKSEGCTPGQMVLRKRTASIEKNDEELPLTFTGKWTGSLSQSDRDYGFYFEMDLQPRAKGQSYIVSEDNGGSAYHSLEWRYDSLFRHFSFKELEVSSKTDPNWPWCIKSGALNYRREANRVVLEGEWSGFIEGRDMETGACASGTIYLEKPILHRSTARAQAIVQEPYEMESKRKIKIARVLEVENEKIKIKVWDNGTVDGDIVTLFLNGQRILHNFRVSKNKMAIPVTLEENDNFLILHAEDLGAISPNTVAVSVDDGVKEQIIILSSNLDESGAVMIRKFRVK